MPCWYFDRKQIKNSPSLRDGIDTNTENRYRREGARFIIDAGTKMGLRCDTCATGVVFFHRFYMFHSFKEFYRYVTAACCLFLAGKVEETPKKCKDIIKIAQSLLSSSSFVKFGEDPREEVMTMERILLKTIKFDFQVEHPYSFLLKYAKNFKSEKEKIQNMAQMAWTFINDSLCTTLSLQWEPEVVGISLMYLASRLTKFEPSDWSGRTSSRSKWWEDWVEGMSMELMEDICHQVLDLYSNKNKKTLDMDSPPASPSKGGKESSTPPPPPPDRPPPKRTREEVKSESEPVPKAALKEKEAKPVVPKQETDMTSSTTSSAPVESDSAPAGAPIPIAQHRSPSYHRNSSSYKSTTDNDGYSAYNPYVSSRMFSSSFMSQEGSQNIQSILAGKIAPQPYLEPRNPPPSHHGPPEGSQYAPPVSAPQPSQYPYLPPSQTQYAHSSIPPSHSYAPPATNPPGFDPYTPPPSASQAFPQPSSYPAPPPVPISQHSYMPPSLPQPHSYSLPHSHMSPHLPPPNLNPPRPGNYPPPSLPYSGHPDPHANYGGVSRNYPPPSGPPGNARKDIPALTEVKISGRSDWNMHK